MASVANLPAMGLDEFLAAHEHAARAATGIVDAPLVGSQHLDQHTYYSGRRVELAALLAFGARELGEKVLVHVAEHVLRAMGWAAKSDVGHQVDELAEALLV